MSGNSDGLITFLQDNAQALGIKLLEQIYLVTLSVTIAILIGIPLGILALNYRRLQAGLLGATSLLQTIPSLALLAFLLPFFGIGSVPAIIALAIYALLPIVQNTVTGIESIPGATIEAARALGFTSWQRLRIVEIPLAMPIIIAGIRIATVTCVGIATLAAFIGAGGLGDFINQGLALNNTRFLLLGAIPAAMLAVLLDSTFGRIEKMFAKNTFRNACKPYFSIGLIIVLVTASILTAFSASFFNGRDQSNVRIATKNFTEQLILGEIMAQLIETKTKLNVVRNFNLGTSNICHQALLNNQIDIYPEYTGTAYLVVLHKPYHQSDAKIIYDAVKQNYAKQFNLIWMPTFGFNNTQALAIREAYAEQQKIKSISDLLSVSDQLTIGAPAEFIQRPDALPGLIKTYHIQFKSIEQFQPGLLYAAIDHHNVDVIMAFSTDGKLLQYHLRLLEDDKHLFPPYDAAPVVRAELLHKHPELVPVLQSLSGKIDGKKMQEMNYEVDLQKRTPAEVARAFLVDAGLVSSK